MSAHQIQMQAMLDQYEKTMDHLRDQLDAAERERARKLYNTLAAKCVIKPTDDELRDLLASLLWTEGLQTDVTDFIRKFPHLDPRTNEPA